MFGLTLAQILPYLSNVVTAIVVGVGTWIVQGKRNDAVVMKLTSEANKTSIEALKNSFDSYVAMQKVKERELDEEIKKLKNENKELKEEVNSLKTENKSLRKEIKTLKSNKEV